MSPLRVPGELHLFVPLLVTDMPWIRLSSDAVSLGELLRTAVKGRGEKYEPENWAQLEVVLSVSAGGK